jgi:hypothetical protein
MKERRKAGRQAWRENERMRDKKATRLKSFW